MSVLASIISTEAPHLPALVVSRVWLHLGWAVVLAWLVAAVGRRIDLPRVAQLGLAAAMAVWACVPGIYAPAHWLGLAFQAPSISLVVLCGWGLCRWFAPASVAQSPDSPETDRLVWTGIVLGWVLLLDTLAVFPVSLYPWGFSPAVPAVALLALLLPWVLRKGYGAVVWRVPIPVIAVLIFIALRLPSGNAWDALLDPWLWLALHVIAVRRWVLVKP